MIITVMVTKRAISEKIGNGLEAGANNSCEVFVGSTGAPQNSFYRRGGHRVGKEETLRPVAAEPCQALSLIATLNALGRNLYIELIGHSYQMTNHYLGFFAAGEIEDELAIDLENIKISHQQIAKHRGLNPEIVNRQAHAQAANARQVVPDSLTLQLEWLALRNLDNEAGSRQTRLLKDIFDELHYARVAELLGREVIRQASLPEFPPQGDLLAGHQQSTALIFEQETGFRHARNEIGRLAQRAWVGSTAQGFNASIFAGFKIDLELIIESDSTFGRI